MTKWVISYSLEFFLLKTTKADKITNHNIHFIFLFFFNVNEFFFFCLVSFNMLTKVRTTVALFRILALQKSGEFSISLSLSVGWIGIYQQRANSHPLYCLKLSRKTEHENVPSWNFRQASTLWKVILLKVLIQNTELSLILMLYLELLNK